MPHLPPSLHDWLSLRGRIPRRVYWLRYTLPVALGSFVAAVVLAVAAPPLEAMADASEFDPSLWLLARLGIATLALLLLFGGILWVAVAGSVKRMHDHGYWGGWYVAWILFGSARVLAEDFVDMPRWLVLVDALVGLCFLIELGFRRGTDGPNRYGPDPLRANWGSGATGAGER